MNYRKIDTLLKQKNLRILGGFHPKPEDDAPPNSKTLILLGPFEPKFWSEFKNSLEYQNKIKNPLDTWSERVISAIAKKLEAEPIFPFGTPPFKPFYKWALLTKRAYTSPINLLVHDTAGLFVSYRGALSFETQIQLPNTKNSPCVNCQAPCLRECPVDAFSNQSYDSSACISHIKSIDSKECTTNGCAARSACPISKTYGRLPEQSAFHMQAFIK